MGSDPASFANSLEGIDFNPRSLHGERLVTVDYGRADSVYFNPRSLHGERLSYTATATETVTFQSTLPAWGATRNRADCLRLFEAFQSTLPAWGATVQEGQTDEA